MNRLALSLLIILTLSSFVFAPSAFAEGSVEEKLEGEVSDQLGELDLSEFERFINGLDTDYFDDGVRETIEKFINGEEVFSFSHIVDVFGGKMLKQVVSCVPMCASIILICILSSTLSRFSASLTGKATENIVQFVCFSAILVLLAGSVYSLAEDIKNTVSALASFMNIIFPIMVTMLVVVGGGGSANIFSPYLAILSSAIVNGLNSVVIPIFFACFALSVVGSLSDDVKLDGVRKFLKTFCDWLLGLGFGIFCTFLAGQSLMSASVDNVTIKATKFALSSYVPILGGYLSDGFDIVLASSVLIKNAVGVTGIFVIFFSILLPLVELIVFSLALKLTAGLTQTIADRRISDMLNGVSSAVSMLITLLLGTAFVFFFVLLLMIYTVNAGVI